MEHTLEETAHNEGKHNSPAERKTWSLDIFSWIRLMWIFNGIYISNIHINLLRASLS